MTNSAKVLQKRFGFNQGISERLRNNLIERGAIFIDVLNAPDRVFTFNRSLRITQSTNKSDKRQLGG